MRDLRSDKLITDLNADNYAIKKLLSLTFNTDFATSTPVIEVYDNSILRTRLWSHGVQKWYLNDGTNEVGRIEYSTPSSLPGILFFNASGAGRSQFEMLTGTGGFGWGVGTGSANPGIQIALTTDHNFGIGTTDQFGGGAGVIGIANATTAPTVTPTGGGVLYATNGELHWLGSSGTDTRIATA